jgi:hypothetical protein
MPYLSNYGQLGNHGLEIWHGNQSINQPYTNGEIMD